MVFRKRNRFLCILLALLCVTVTGCSKIGPATQETAADKHITITVWTYYNGPQLMAFDTMIAEFNETVGREEGIRVMSANLGSVTDLETAVKNAAEGKVGADEMPDIFAAYADTAYAIDRMGLLADLDDYLTAEDQAVYIDSFIEEGRIGADGSLKIFPVAKSTELLLINATDFVPFASDCDVRYDDLKTMEGLVAVAELYYNWTDAKTPEPDDGKALFGRDAMANYFLVGAAQMGVNIIDVHNGVTTIHFDKEVIKRLWDCYYIPYIKGHFASSGRFRSDDVTTGNILCYVGSSASATYFPTQVTTDDTTRKNISMRVLSPPVFADGTKVAVQQGAGMVVAKSDPETEAACVTFLKWFTQSERNIRFAYESAYMPVTKDALSMEAIKSTQGVLPDNMERILEAAVNVIHSNKLYTQKAFAYGTDARSVLEYAMSDIAVADRERVEVALAAGTEYGAAIAPYTSDEYFDAWYAETLERLVRYADAANRQTQGGNGADGT